MKSTMPKSTTSTPAPPPPFFAIGKPLYTTKVEEPDRWQSRFTYIGQVASGIDQASLWMSPIGTLFVRKAGWSKGQFSAEWSMIETEREPGDRESRVHRAQQIGLMSIEKWLSSTKFKVRSKPKPKKRGRKSIKQMVKEAIENKPSEPTPPNFSKQQQSYSTH